MDIRPKGKVYSKNVMAYISSVDGAAHKSAIEIIQRLDMEISKISMNNGTINGYESAQISDTIQVGTIRFISDFETRAVFRESDRLMICDLLLSIPSLDRKQFLVKCDDLQKGMKSAGLARYGAEKLIKSAKLILADESRNKPEKKRGKSVPNGWKEDLKKSSGENYNSYIAAQNAEAHL